MGTLYVVGVWSGSGDYDNYWTMNYTSTHSKAKADAVVEMLNDIFMNEGIHYNNCECEENSFDMKKLIRVKTELGLLNPPEDGIEAMVLEIPCME